MPRRRFAPVKLATNGSAGAETSSCAVPSWSSRPSTSTPIRSASAAASSKSWVTSSVGRPSSRRSACSSARTDVRVCASRAASGSSRSRTSGLARERPGERDPLALAARELARPRVARGARSRSARAARRGRRSRRRRRSGAPRGAGRARSPGTRARPSARSGGSATPRSLSSQTARRARSARAPAARARRSSAARSSCPRRTGRRARPRRRPRALPRGRRSGEEAGGRG